MIGNAGDFGYRLMHGLIYLRARGHLLSMYWRYITLTTLTLYHSPSAVHAGLQAALQGLMVAMSVLHVLSCSNV